MSRPEAGKITVPDELRDVLLEFTISYLLEQPGDVVEYAVDFFNKLLENRTAALRLGEGVDSPDESVISDVEEPPVTRFSTRRKSVFAETYNPEEDEDDDEGTKVVYPKSDQQRERLAESVKHILLFRALDKEQMQDVLDAMFEKTVQLGEYVIKQGDDGDNFYVIERAATIQAASEGALWGMDRQTFRRILLKSAFKKRKMYEALLESVPMLKALQVFLDVDAFERLLGPCMNIMKRNINDYEDQLVRIFGSKTNITDIR
ncbi:cAMP-dependent protein kinase type II regulatory subunit [Blattella germanica]|nr:cAMP-dependent protein kinase type II regulatory subunit [Blattella germanica]